MTRTRFAAVTHPAAIPYIYGIEHESSDLRAGGVWNSSRPDNRTHYHNPIHLTVSTHLAFFTRFHLCFLTASNVETGPSQMYPGNINPRARKATASFRSQGREAKPPLNPG